MLHACKSIGPECITSLAFVSAREHHHVLQFPEIIFFLLRDLSWNMLKFIPEKAFQNLTRLDYL